MISVLPNIITYAWNTFIKTEVLGIEGIKPI